MEIPMHPNEDPIIKVYQLYIIKTGNAGKTLNRPTAIPFSSMNNLKRHLLEIALRSEVMERRFKLSIELLKQQENWDNAIETLRVAQAGNKVPLEFDFWWEEEPHILL